MISLLFQLTPLLSQLYNIFLRIYFGVKVIKTLHEAVLTDLNLLLRVIIELFRDEHWWFILNTIINSTPDILNLTSQLCLMNLTNLSLFLFSQLMTWLPSFKFLTRWIIILVILFHGLALALTCLAAHIRLFLVAILTKSWLRILSRLRTH